MSLGKIGKLTNVFNAFKQSPFSNTSSMISTLASFGDINKAAKYSLVTQFYVEGLDDYNIDLANFKNSVITDLSYFCCEPYMNATLQEKYTAWQEYRESCRDEYCDLSREYNKNLDVLAELTNRVPVDTAKNDWFGQKVEDLKEAYNSNMAIVKGLESIHVDEEGNFDLEDLKNSSDWSLYESIMNYTLPAIVAALQAQDETVEGYGKANELNDRLLNLQEREGKEAYVNLSQDNIRFEEKNGYRFVELKFDNITKVPISNIDIKGCGKRIIGFKEKNFHVNSKGTSVFISKYENIRDNMTYDPLSNRYYLYFSDYKETFRILSFKVIITSLYGVSTVQYFNVLMLKSHVANCMCTL